VSLERVGKTLADVDLGGLDAESDYKLAAHFVETSHVDRAVAGRRTLFLGRKGSGKSALFRQLPTIIKDRNRSPSVVQVIELTPDEYAWAALRGYEEQGLLPEHAHTNAWKLTLAIAAAGAIASADRSWSSDAGQAVDRLRQFVRENFGELQPSMLATATKVVKGLKSFNLSAFGFGVGFDRNEEDRQPITPAVIAALIDTLEVPLREQSLFLELDRLDDSWDGSEQAEHLLIGLLKAAKDMNDRFGAGAKGLRVLVFLRSDIYDGLQFDDKDKHRPLEEHILWDQNVLGQMLSKRLPDEIDAGQLFEPGEMRGSIKPFNYIVKRTFLRPREILQFVDLALSQANPSATEISKDAIRDAETLYSRWKVEDLQQEFSKVHPEFGTLLEALRQEVHRYDSIEDLGQVLERKAPEAIARTGIRRAIETLFDASVIGIRLRASGSPRFKSEDPQLQLPAEGVVYVHQSLYKGLNIVEARRPTEGLAVEPADEDEAVAGRS
jgi:energy-coupling factor transporter ATP-binding protein EcfA2